MFQQLDELGGRRREHLPLAVDDADRARSSGAISRTAARVPARTASRTGGSGRMLTPAPISTACLIVSMLSNSMTIVNVDRPLPQVAIDLLADAQVAIEGDEILALQVLGGDRLLLARRCWGLHTSTIRSERSGMTLISGEAIG